MNLFINDILVKILKTNQKPRLEDFNTEINCSRESITKAKLINHVWLNQAQVSDVDIILDLLNAKVPLNLLSLIITPKDFRVFKKHLKSKFKVIHAAGGLIRKKDKFLMIYRMRKWDLPKGKKENGESSKQAAIREVQEECTIQVKLNSKICITWHTYTMNKSNILKKTKWYAMDLVDDTNSKPCEEEGIEELCWMKQKEVYHALENSYNSIRFVFEEYYNKIKDKDKINSSKLI